MILWARKKKRLGTSPASIIYSAARCKQTSSASLVIVLGFLPVISVTVFVLEDTNAAVVASADTGTYVRRIAAGADHRDGCHLGNEDSIVLGVRRHRMRVR
jgi:hypothetical protein